jgi:hypothetical protein
VKKTKPEKHFVFFWISEEQEGEEKEKSVRTDVIHDGVKLGLVPRGEENVEPRFGELNRKLASDAIRCARNN